MESYNMGAALDRDRVFDGGNLEELLTQGKNILSEAIRIGENLQKAAANISTTYAGINDEYKVQELRIDALNVMEMITANSSGYQETIAHMERNLTKLRENLAGKALP